MAVLIAHGKNRGHCVAELCCPRDAGVGWCGMRSREHALEAVSLVRTPAWANML